jgi:hypothetical protein
MGWFGKEVLSLLSQGANALLLKRIMTPAVSLMDSYFLPFGIKNNV